MVRVVVVVVTMVMMDRDDQADLLMEMVVVDVSVAEARPDSDLPAKPKGPTDANPVKAGRVASD